MYLGSFLVLQLFLSVINSMSLSNLKISNKVLTISYLEEENLKLIFTALKKSSTTRVLLKL